MKATIEYDKQYWLFTFHGEGVPFTIKIPEKAVNIVYRDFNGLDAPLTKVFGLFRAHEEYRERMEWYNNYDKNIK